MQNGNKKRLKYIWTFGKKYWVAFAIAEVCILVSYTVSVLLPINLTRLTDDVLLGGRYDLLSVVIRDYCILFIVSTLFNFIYAFTWQYLNNHYVLDIKKQLFSKMIYSKVSFLSGINVGDLMTRIDNDSEQFIHVVQRNVLHFINSALMCMGIIVIVAKINYVIAILLIVAAVLPIIITRIGGRFTESSATEIRKRMGDVTGKLYEIIRGIREINILNAFTWAEKETLGQLNRLLHLGNQVRRVDFLVGKGIDLVNLISTLTIYCVSVYFVLQNKLTVGMFLAAIQYISLLHRKFNWILRIWLDWYNRKVSIDRVSEILELESEVSGSDEIEKIKTVEFQNVEFGYDVEYPILKGINLKINEGERVGIIGPSGIGKTTLTSLLLGFYPLNGGSILINGLPLSSVNHMQLRKKIGVVSQDIMIFEDTIRYNLNLGDNYSDDEIYAVLKDVNLLEIIDSMPEKIDTIISPVSYNLSGGQKQRLMIARMLLRKPDFIILDEATSALDVETEKIVSQTINTAAEKSTVLVISHRFESIRNCNKIVVINNHTIEAIGTSEYLAKESTTYATLFGK